MATFEGNTSLKLVKRFFKSSGRLFAKDNLGDVKPFNLSQFVTQMNHFENFHRDLLSLVCFYHVTYAFRVNLHSGVAWIFRFVWRLSNCNRTRTHKHLVCKRTLNHLAKLAWSELASCVFDTRCSHQFVFVKKLIQDFLHDIYLQIA